eukprot:Amastigsp_a846677_3.p2 type:complete len:103 gc:universal Amastigsp_a846677_3:698-390(-)
MMSAPVSWRESEMTRRTCPYVTEIVRRGSATAAAAAAAVAASTEPVVPNGGGGGSASLSLSSAARAARIRLRSDWMARVSSAVWRLSLAAVMLGRAGSCSSP